MSLYDDYCWDAPFIVLHQPTCRGGCTPRPIPPPDENLSLEEQEVIMKWFVALGAAAAQGELPPEVGATLEEMGIIQASLIPGLSVVAIPMADDLHEMLLKKRRRRHKRDPFGAPPRDE